MANQTRDELLKTVEGLRRLIEEMPEDQPVDLKVAVSVPVEDLEEIQRIYKDLDDDTLLKLRRRELGWLKAHLSEDNEAWRYRGNYLGSIGYTVRAWSGSRDLVVLELEAKLGVDLAAKAIIVPFQVPDEEANDEWLELQDQLGLDIHPS